jgi:hypothetical protein
VKLDIASTFGSFVWRGNEQPVHEQTWKRSDVVTFVYMAHKLVFFRECRAASLQVLAAAYAEEAGIFWELIWLLVEVGLGQKHVPKRYVAITRPTDFIACLDIQRIGACCVVSDTEAAIWAFPELNATTLSFDQQSIHISEWSMFENANISSVVEEFRRVAET